MNNQCFKNGVIRLGRRPAGLIGIALFPRKQDLVCVYADDVCFDKLFKTGWSGNRRDRGFVRAEGDPNNKEHNSQGLAGQSLQDESPESKPLALHSLTPAGILRRFQIHGDGTVRIKRLFASPGYGFLYAWPNFKLSG